VRGIVGVLLGRVNATAKGDPTRNVRPRFIASKQAAQVACSCPGFSAVERRCDPTLTPRQLPLKCCGRTGCGGVGSLEDDSHFRRCGVSGSVPTSYASDSRPTLR
jgi:hypothetical protein